jgi:predicted PurR-regulated permease PerM
VDDLGSIRRSLTLIATICLFTALYFARDLFLPITAAVLVALTFSPVVRALGRFGLPAPLSAFMLISSTGFILVSAAYLLSGPISEFFTQAPQMAIDLRRKLAGLLEAMRVIQEASQNVEELSSGASAPKVAIEQPGMLVFAAGTTASVLSLMAVALVLAFFLLASGDLFYIKLVESVPTFSDKRRAVRLVRDIERQMSHYLLTVTVINALLGLCLGAAMYWVGMPNPMLWGVLGFALNFIPFVGALAGAAAVAAVGILTFDGTLAGFLPAAVYLSITTVEGQFITPSIVGRRLELNTVSVLLALIIWSWLWSVPGALMAVPLLVLIKVTADNTKGFQTLGSFLGTDQRGKITTAES